MTRKRYLFDNRLNGSATVIAIGRRGESADDYRPFVVLDETLFQNDSRKQSGDCGLINSIPLVRITEPLNAVTRHHLDVNDVPFSVGERVILAVDADRRIQLSQRRCFGKLIGILAKELCGDVEVTAECFLPHCSRVDISGFVLPDAHFVKKQLQEGLATSIASDLPVQVFGQIDKPGSRQVQIGTYKPFASSGTYPDSLAALTHLEILDVEQVGGCLQVRYSVSETKRPDFGRSVAEKYSAAAILAAENRRTDGLRYWLMFPHRN